MVRLASLKSTMDLTDETWLAEEAYTTQGFTAVDMAYEEYYVALYYSCLLYTSCHAASAA